MLHPIISNNNGQLRYNDLLQEAEIERLLRQSQADRPSLRQRSGDLLIWLGQRLQTRPQQPAYRVK